MLLQCTQKMEPPHFNLYFIDGDNYVLMTKDHILPHSKGGKDVIDNYQTMCEICNNIKAHNIVSIETLRDARSLYNKVIEREGHRKALNLAKNWLEATILERE